MSRIRRLLLWTLPAAAASLSALVLGGGLVAALSGRLGEPAASLPVAPPALPHAPPAGDLLVVGLGDSLTRGAGDGRQGGWASRLATALERPGRRVALRNSAVDGAETTDLLRSLERPEVDASVRQAQLVLVSIGGNDLTHSLRAAPDPAALSAALAGTRANLASALARVRALNPQAPLRLVGLYNPAPFDATLAAPARRALLVWNGVLAECASDVPGAVFVPVADLFEARADRISADRFHPGPAGHEAIAARVLATLPQGLGGESGR